MADSSLGDFRPVADRVFVAVAEPATVNIGLVLGEAEALLIDTGSSPGQGAQIRRAAGQLTGDLPLTTVIVTHHHYDHLFGLAAFADLRTIAHHRLVTTDEHEPVPDWLAVALGTDWRPTMPNEPMTTAEPPLDLGDCPVKLWAPGRGHTDHDLVVWLPGCGVCFLGDLAESSGWPVAGPDAWPAEWPGSLRRVAERLPADATLVPGHGPVLGSAALAQQCAELDFLNDRACALAATGQSAAGSWRPDWPWPPEAAERFITQALRRLP